MLVLRVPAVALMAALFSLGVIQATEDTAAELFLRGEQWQAKGQYAEAEPLYKEALVTEEHILGSDCPEIIPMLNALADLYHVQGRDREAEPVCRRALGLGESRLHPQDLAIATSLTTLADICSSTYRYASAEPLYRRALAILEATPGTTQPSVGRVYSNLASLRVKAGQYDEADELFRRALAISERAGPASNLQVAEILNHIAVCDIERGRFAAAEPYLLRSMRIREAVLTSDDPVMISLLETYALVLRKTRQAAQPLTVKLFNDAGVGGDVLRRAKEDAAWLLKSVYVDLTWVPCVVVSRSNLTPCRAPVRAIELHILKSPATNDFGEETLGIAMPHFGSGDHAGVFLSRVRQLAIRNSGIIDVSELLGCVMAHEIGHLLLHSTAHSSEGLMRAEFRPADLRKAAQRQLKFTPEQGSQLTTRRWEGEFQVRRAIPLE